MDKNNQSGGGNFLAGLFMGAVLGGGAVFLFGTKKGNKVLKLLTEEGLDKVSDVSEMVSDTLDDKFPQVKEAIEDIPEQIIEHPEVKHAVKQLRTTTRKFFKNSSHAKKSAK